MATMKVPAFLGCIVALLVANTGAQTVRELADMILSTDRNLRNEIDWLRKDLKEERSERQNFYEKLNETISIIAKGSPDNEKGAGATSENRQDRMSVSAHARDSLQQLKSEFTRLKRSLKEEKGARKAGSNMLDTRLGNLGTAIQQGHAELLKQVMLIVESLKVEFHQVKQEVKQEVGEVKLAVGQLTMEVAEVKRHTAEVKQEVGQARLGIDKVKQEVGKVNKKVRRQGEGFNRDVMTIQQHLTVIGGNQRNAKDLQSAQSTQISGSLQTLMTKLDLAGLDPSDMPTACSIPSARDCTTVACCLDVFMKSSIQGHGYRYGFDDIRLTELKNGTEVSGGNSGRLEILHDGEWGTVSDNWNRVTVATSVCRILGYPRGRYRRMLYGDAEVEWSPPPQRVWLNYIHCEDMSTSLYECAHSPWGKTTIWGHERDVGVICSYDT